MKSVQYLCLMCGSQGTQILREQRQRVIICPRCGNPAAPAPGTWVNEETTYLEERV